MDQLWSPWRYQYLKEGRGSESCVFCDLGASSDDAAGYVVYRGTSNFVVLNRYPYATGHVLVVPYEHVATLEKAPAETADEMMRLTQKLEGALRWLYRAGGVNIGMNIGEAAGAGVAGHIQALGAEGQELNELAAGVLLKRQADSRDDRVLA